MITKDWKSEWDEEFKCIQFDCDGFGNIAVGDNENGWHAEQCEFHAKYLIPQKAFIDSLLSSYTEKVLGELKGAKRKVGKLSFAEHLDEMFNGGIDIAIEVITRLNKE